MKEITYKSEGFEFNKAKLIPLNISQKDYIKTLQEMMKVHTDVFYIALDWSLAEFVNDAETMRVGYKITKVYKDEVYYRAEEKHTSGLSWGEVKIL